MVELVFDPNVVFSHCLIPQDYEVLDFTFSNDKELRSRLKGKVQ